MADSALWRSDALWAVPRLRQRQNPAVNHYNPFTKNVTVVLHFHEHRLITYIKVMAVLTH